MSRGPRIFKQKDIQRAIRAATAAGLQVSGVKIDPKTGVIEVVTGASPLQDSQDQNGGNEWDSVLNR